MNTMKWVDSNGGPLVFMPMEVIATWGGIRRKGDRSTDYERACAVKDEIGIIPSDVENANIVVLGDEPNRTAWFSKSSALVRWIWADNETALLGALSILDKASFVDTQLAVTVRGSGQWCLFDSAEAGSQVRGASDLVVLARGNYRIFSCQIDIGSSARILVHRFRPWSN
ncbi:immunity 21 family protein [Pendulispora brunnea]|uniref:Immunity 21 family protein n=1 Tax=Pendulispora brunnea TaxID=2905690 RepID=A0ABZ2KBF5_9BACT